MGIMMIKSFEEFWTQEGEFLSGHYYSSKVLCSLAWNAAVKAERQRCFKIVDPGDMEALECRGGEEGLEMLRDLAELILSPPKAQEGPF
jgi:hypothetical protein